jgi:tetratricopeptide (TPR) repeat protein
MRAAERLARAAGEPTLEARAQLALSYLAGHEVAAWSAHDHLAEAERVARICDKHGDDVGLAFALREQACTHLNSGRADEAARLAERAVDIARRIADRWHEASYSGLLALCLADGPTPVSEAIVRCERVLERIDPSAEVVPKVKAALAIMYAEAGRLDEGRVLVEEVLGRARASGATWHVMGLSVSGMRVELAAGAYDRAAAHWRSLCSLLEAENYQGSLPYHRAVLSCLLFRLGEIDEARELALVARSTAGSPDDFYQEVALRSALALVEAHDGRIEKAMRLSNEALARANASDLLTYRGRRLEDTAIVRRLGGDDAGSRAALEEALDLYERKGSVTHAEQVRRQLEIG